MGDGILLQPFAACFSQPTAAKKPGRWSFWLCTELRELHIPAGCSIGKKCFDKCQTLARVFSYSVTPPIVEEDAFADIQFVAEAILTVPVGAKSAYSQAIGWQRFTRIEEVENLAAEMIASEMPRCTPPRMGLSSMVSGQESHLPFSSLEWGAAWRRRGRGQ